jgi:hypothetical protein
MNGNFSFGDYFKEGAIGYAWSLLTTPESEGGLGFDEKDLWVTVYEEDDEAIELWTKIAGIPLAGTATTTARRLGDVCPDDAARSEEARKVLRGGNTPPQS